MPIFIENPLDFPGLRDIYEIFSHRHNEVILLAGYRNASNGKSWDIGDIGYAWLDGSVDGENAPYAGHNRDGDSNSDMNYHHNGYSVIPCFGERTSYFLWIIMFLLEDIFRAYYDCRKNKRNTVGALEFELHYESECIKLWQEIQDRNYILRPCTAFIVRDPVQREIFASHFRDRIIHHLIARKLEPLLERALIHDVYNSRKGKGTHYGIKRVEKFLRSASDNYKKDAYILKLDIRGFFMSIDRERLWEKVNNLICPTLSFLCMQESSVPTIPDEFITLDSGTSQEGPKQRTKQIPGIPEDEQDKLRYLIKIIIFSDVKESVIIKGKRTDWVGLPKSKSLFYTEVGKGLPIGNLTSQIFANIYMHEFDIFIKKTLKIQYYGRYVDDFILIHKNKEYLKSCIPAIREFLKGQLGLTLHPKKIYLQHYTRGVLFLGTYLSPWRTYVGNRTKGNFYRLIQSINTRLSQDESLREDEVNMLLSQINAYLGLMGHTRSYRLREKMIERLDKKFGDYFQISDDYSKILQRK